MKKNRRSIWAEVHVAAGIRTALLVVLAFSFLVNLLVLTSPLYMMQVYDRVLASQQVETLVYLSIIALIAFAVLGILEAVRSYLLTRLGSYIDLALRDSVLTQVIEQSRQQGSLAARKLIEDLNNVRNYLGSSAVLPFLDAPWVPFFLLVMLALHPWMGALGLASALILCVMSLLNDVLTRRSIQSATQQQLIANEFATNAIANAETVRAMGMQTAISHRYMGAIEQMSDAHRQAGDAGAILSSISKALRLIMQSAALGLGAYLVIESQMSPGGMIAASILLGRALAPIEQSIGSWRQFVTARASYAQLKEFLSATLFNPDPLSLPQVTGRLAVESVSLVLPGYERPILRNISLSVPAGTAVALIGPTGSGKSMLCRLMVGALAPSGGAVRLSAANVRDLSPVDAGRYIGYLPQTVELFEGTVRDNIARMGHVDDALVVAAANAAGCHEMILRLPNGYMTELGVRGSALSGGQRQRIGLARALYGRPRLLVLDEPNANLDQDGERALVDAMRLAKEDGATVVVVSHRSTLLAPIDKIGFIRDGVLERWGDRDQILRDLQTSTENARPRLVPQPGPAAAAEGST